MQTSFEVVMAVTKVEVGIQYSPPQSDADSEVMEQNEAEPLNVIISSQEEAVKDELDVPEVISEAMQQQAQEFANSDENSVTEKEDSDSDIPVKRVTRNRGVNK